MAKQKSTNDDKNSSKEQVARNALLREEQKLVDKIYRLRELIAKTDESNAKNDQQRSQFARIRAKAEEDLKQILQAQNELTESSVEHHRSLSQEIKSRLVLENDLVSIADSYTDRLIRTRIEMDSISDVGRSLTKDMKANVDMTSLFQDVLGEAIVTLQNGTDLSEDFTAVIKDSVTISDKYNDIGKQIAESAKDAVSGEYKKLDLSKEYQELAIKQQKLDDKTKKFEEEMKDMDEKAIKARKKELDLEQKLLDGGKQTLDTFKKQNTVLEEASNQAKKTLGVFDKMMELDFKGAIREGFGFDDLKKDIKDKVGASFVKVVKEVRGEGGLVGGIKAAGAGFGQMVKMAPMFMKALGIGALMGIVGFIVDAFHKVDEEVSQLGKDMGISKHEAIELHHTATDLAGEMKLVGINSAEVAKGIKMTSEMMGGIDIASRLASGNEQAKQLVKDVTVLSEKFGLSADEIKNVQDLATMSGKSMGQLTAEATTLNKGLMTSKESMKLLASIPKGVAVAFKGGTQELIKAAAKAKLLGMELGKVQGIGMGMLEIESSLEKEMEARVLTGKNLNLDAARYYALQGDTASLQDELLKQAGSLKDFQAMGPIQQKAMADAMNMTVEEMTTMLTNAENLKNLGIDQAKLTDLQSMNAEQLNAELAKGGSKQYQDYVRNLAKEKESEETKKKLTDAVTKLQEKLAKMVTPLIEFADKFLGILDSVGGLDILLQGVGAILAVIATVWVGNKLLKGFQAIKGSVSALKDGISGFFDMIKGPGSKAMDTLKDGASAVTDKVSGAAEKLKENTGKMKTPKGGGKQAGGFLKNLVQSIKDIQYGDIIKVAAAIVILSAAIGVAAIAFKLFGDVDWNSVAKGLVTLAVMVGAVMLLGNAAGNMVVGAAAVVILSASLLVAAKAMQEFSNGVSWDGVLMGITTLGALTLAVLALGALMLSGVGGAAILAGAAALLILSAALLVMGIAMQQFAKAAVILIPFLESITTIDVGKIASLGGALLALGASLAGLALMALPMMIGVVALLALSGALSVLSVVGPMASKSLQSTIEQIKVLSDLDFTKLMGASVGILALGTALLAFGTMMTAGSIVGGIGSMLGGLFGAESPLDQVMKITEKLDPSKLGGTAKAIRDLADSFKYFAEETGKLKEFDTDKLDSIIERMEKVRQAEGSGGLSTAVSGVANAVTGFIGNLFGSPEKQSAQPVTSTATGGGGVVDGGEGSMINVEKKLDVLISVLSKAVSQPTIIKFGDKTVEEIQTQLNFKKGYDVKVDNTYGRA